MALTTTPLVLAPLGIRHSSWLHEYPGPLAFTLLNAALTLSVLSVSDMDPLDQNTHVRNTSRRANSHQGAER